MGTLWLIGMMGTGKSTVAPLVAGVLGRAHVDTDEEIVSRAGRSVGEIFDSGEDHFRRLESEVVADLAARDLVVACGGGVVLDPSNVSVMREGGLVVLLAAPIEVLVERVAGGGARPLLAGDVVSRLTEIGDERRSRYDAAAHVAVDAGGTLDEVVGEVIAAWSASLSEE